MHPKIAQTATSDRSKIDPYTKSDQTQIEKSISESTTHIFLLKATRAINPYVFGGHYSDPFVVTSSGDNYTNTSTLILFSNVKSTDAGDKFTEIIATKRKYSDLNVSFPKNEDFK